MSRYETSAELRAAVERSCGPLGDDLWRAVAPPEYAGPWDSYDLEEIVRDIRSRPEFLHERRREAETIREGLGITSGARLVGDYLIGVASLSRSIGIPSEPPDTWRLTGEEWLSLGQMLAVATAARAMSERTGLPRATALWLILDLSKSLDSYGLEGFAEDAAAATWRLARRYNSLTFGPNYELSNADRLIRAEFYETALRLLLKQLDGTGLSDREQAEFEAIARDINRHRRGVEPTWHYCWMTYEAEHAHRLRRSFGTVDAYRVAVRRANKEMLDFLNDA